MTGSENMDPRGPAWFVAELLPRWIDAVSGLPGAHPSYVAERLDAAGRPVMDPGATWTQARVVFALAHLHLVTGDPHFLSAARRCYPFMDECLRRPDGGYRVAVATDGGLLADPLSQTCRTYDQSFALLALVTLRRAAPDLVPESRVSDCWGFVETSLTDPATGGLWESDAMARQANAENERRGQNPHMHMLEAVLQAQEMTGDPVWRDRAERLVSVAERYLIDDRTGAVREFVGPRLEPGLGAEGDRREPGHQFEWAWLLERHAGMGGAAKARDLAARMQGFGSAHGLRRDGPMAGALFDAVDSVGTVTEDTHLLWPLTEAGKFWAARYSTSRDPEDAARARRCADLVFRRFFGPADGPPVWVNQVSGDGSVLWPEALSRVVYHIVLLVTEGARAGCWTLSD